MALQADTMVTIAASPAVRERLVRGGALLVLDAALQRVIWANDPGARLFGFASAALAEGQVPPLGALGRRQLAATRGFPRIAPNQPVALRLSGGMSSRILNLSASAIALPEGDAVLLAGPADNQIKAEAALSGLGPLAALVDRDAGISSASPDWPGLAPDVAAALVEETGREPGHVAHRAVAAGERTYTARLAWLDQEHGLLLLEEVAAAAEAEQTASGADADQVASAEVSPLPPPPDTSSLREAEPVRFTWRTDAESRFTGVSPQLSALLGFAEDAVVGQSFAAVAERFGFDKDGAIAGLLSGRATWSGRTLDWPVADGRATVPVDLAALPVFGRGRVFEGFRGFGIARPKDASEVEPVADPEQADEQQPIAPLEPHEAYAFREIGERLRRDREAPAVVDQPALEDLDQPEVEAADAASLASNDNEPLSGEHGAPDDENASSDDGDAIAPGSKAASPGELSGAAVSEAVSHDGDHPARDVAETRRDAPDTSILERLPVPLLVHAGDVLHFANAEFLSLTGYPSLDALQDGGGIAALLAVPEEDAAPVTDRRMRLTTASGEQVPVDALLRSVPWAGGNALLLVLRRLDRETSETEATARRELEQRVAELRTILDTATDGVVLIAPDGTIRSLSRPAEALFGLETDEARNRAFGTLFAVESQRAVTDYLGALFDNGVRSVLNDGREVIGREKGGGMIPLFMTVGRLPEDSGFCAVLRDITHWKRAEEQLTQSRAEAERASSHKTDFLARVSHEIRTPLNAIIGFSELMLDEKFGPVSNDRYRDYLRDINRSGNHVLDLVNDLLDISKIEAGEQEMAYEAVPLNETLAETVATMQPQANRERVIIRSSLAPKLPDVVADLRSIRQIALNILSNAIRYTQAGGQVIVSTALDPSGDVALRVRDTGIGMTQGEIEQAMKPFRQINSLKRPRGDGTGLGLPLTKAMVEANRAQFSISSTPGEGTLVEIVFPATRVLAG